MFEAHHGPSEPPPKSSELMIDIRSDRASDLTRVSDGIEGGSLTESNVWSPSATVCIRQQVSHPYLYSGAHLWFLVVGNTLYVPSAPWRPLGSHTLPCLYILRRSGRLRSGVSLRVRVRVRVVCVDAARARRSYRSSYRSSFG